MIYKKKNGWIKRHDAHISSIIKNNDTSGKIKRIGGNRESERQKDIIGREEEDERVLKGKSIFDSNHFHFSFEQHSFNVSDIFLFQSNIKFANRFDSSI